MQCKMLPHMPFDDSSIIVLLKYKLEYKSICMLGYVWPNIIIKVL
jgi:hypothetical protein